MSSYSFLILILIMILLPFFQSSFKIANVEAAWNYTDRNWYLGGQFSEVYNNDGSVVTANNIAEWNGMEWSSMGTGTDGPVSRIFVDWCKTVYIAGSFTSVDGIDTGPVAMWRPALRRWETLGQNGTEWDTDNEIKINGMTVNCRHIPENQLECLCDVFVVGKFKLYTQEPDNATAVNVARYNSVTERWESMGGVDGHGLEYDGPGEVLEAYCTNIAVAILTMRHLWIGGTFPGGIKEYDLRSPQRGWKTVEGLPDDAEIWGFEAEDEQWYMGRISVFGKFHLETEDGDQCHNVCDYNILGQRFQHHENDIEELNGHITRYKHMPTDVYIVSGSFTGDDDSEPSYLAYMNEGEELEIISESAETFITEPVSDIAVCLTSTGCTIGSVGFVGSHTGRALFYDKADDTFSTFGQGVNGVIKSIGTGDLANFRLLDYNSSGDSIFVESIVTRLMTLMFLIGIYMTI